MNPRHRLLTFGGLRLVRDGSSADGALAQRRRLALLALLSASAHGHSREGLLALFWPESDEERARNSLSQLIHGVRRELGDGAIRSAGSRLELDPTIVESDVNDFIRATAAGDHAGAVELHRGPFLDGVYLRDAPGFDRWVDDRRSHFARLYRDSLESLARAASQRGDAAGAVHWWQRCAAADPLDGRIARAFLEALVADGQRESAIRHASVHADLVRAELDAEPDARVMSYADELRGPSSVGSVDAPSPRSAPALSAPTGPEMVARAPHVGLAYAARGSAATEPFAAARSTMKPPGIGYRRVALATTGLILLGAGIAAARLAQRPGFDDGLVVVAAFENRTGDSTLAPIGFMASDWIAQGLQRTNLIRVVDPESAREASLRARDAQVPLGDSREVGRMAADTRARIVVTGSMYRDDVGLLMSARVSDAMDKRLIEAPEPIRFAAGRPGDAIEPLRERLMGALAMRLDPRLDPIVPPGSTHPPTHAAYVEFMLGIAAHQRRDGTAGRHFARASELDSAFALAITWELFTGPPLARRDSLLRRFVAMRERLTPLDRASLAYFEAEEQRGKVLAAATAARLAPGSHWNHNLANSLFNLGRFDEAVRSFEQVERSRGWMRGWPVFWDRFSAALHLSGDHERDAAIAREARKALPATNGLPIYLEARALAAGGRVDELRRVVRDLAVHREFADSLGRWLSLLARELETSGDTVSARQMHDEAIAWFRSLPPAELERPRHQLHYGITLYRAGRWSEARSVFERVLPDSSVNRRDSNMDPLGHLGGVYAHLGDTVAANVVIRRLGEDLDRAKGSVLLWSARIAAAMNDRDRAVEFLRQRALLPGVAASHHYDHADFDALVTYPPFRALAALTK